MIVINHNQDEDVFETFNGKKVAVKAKMPKTTDTVLTCSLPPRFATPLIKEGVEILRCSEKTVKTYANANSVDALAEATWELYHEVPNTFKKIRIEPPLASYYHIFKDFQKMRVAASNRLWHDNSEQMSEFLTTLEKAENQAKAVVEKELEKFPVYTEWLTKIRGIGPSMAGGLVALVGDCSRFPTVSSLWAYSGYAVHDGKIQKLTKGQQANWNTKIKPHCYNIVVSMMKQQTPVYSNLYYEEKALHLARGLTKGHAHNRAVRKVAKIFLEHFWKVSRELAGLETGQPWIIGQGRHSHYVSPPEWK